MRRRTTCVAAIGAWLAIGITTSIAAGQSPAPSAAPPPGSPTAPSPSSSTPLDISADRMTGSHGPEGDEVQLDGNVRIIRGRAVITAEHGRYLRNAGMLHLERNVRLVDSTTTVTCDKASYAEFTDILHLEGHVHVVDREATLDAPWATYDRREGRIDLHGGARARDQRQQMEADSVTYHRDDQVLEARGNVRGVDEENRLHLTAGAVDYDRTTSVAEAWRDPLLISREEKGPPTHIRARLLRINTESRLAEAIDSVRVERDTMHASADYGQFDDPNDYGLMTGHPRAWDDETEVSGDTLEFWTDDNRLNRVVVIGNADVGYRGMREQNRDEQNRLVGDRVDVFFTDNEIDSLVATGKAGNQYQAVPKEGKTPESNQAQGDTITVFFTDRKVTRAVIEGNASGEYRFAVDPSDTAAVSAERVVYRAPRIEYQVAEDRIVLDREAQVNYRDLELKSQRVVFDVGEEALTAEGQPELMDRGERVVGKLMTYDLESRVGNIYEAETQYETGLYHGRQIRKVNENELQVARGSYSTCDQVDAHYHFAARRMKIYLKDKVVAKPIVLYVKNVPLLALPFWVFPVRPGRHSGVLIPRFELGFNREAGQFIRNVGYYWAANDYMDFTLAGDYYQAEPSWVLRADMVYKLLYVLDGEINTSYARNEGAGEENWDLDAYHTQELTPNTRLAARGSYVSSREYSQSNLYGRPLSQRLNRFLTSNIAISHTAAWAAFNGVVDRRQDLDAADGLDDPDGDGPQSGPPVGSLAPLPSLTASLPSITLSFPTRALGSIGMLRGTPLETTLANVYLSLSSRYLYYQEERAFVEQRVLSTPNPGEASIEDSILVIGERRTVRNGFQTDISVSDARRALGWINLRPILNSTVAVFDHDVEGNKNVPAGVWSAGLAASTTFYGTFAPGIGALEGVRHVVFPSVSMTYSPEFPGLVAQDSAGNPIDRFESFGSIGISGFKQFRMNMALEQRLQVKVRRKNEIQRLDNLLSWTMGANYNFLWREQNQVHPLSTIGSAVTLTPPRFVNATFSWVTDVYNPKPLRTFNYNLGMNLSSTDARNYFAAPDLALDRNARKVQPFTDQWNVAFAFSYAGGYAFDGRWLASRNANLVTSYQMSPAWSVEYSAAYDVTNRRMGTQRFSLVRDLHCWQASFTRTFMVGGEDEYYFKIGVKEQPEIYIDRGTRAISIGGIQ